MASESHRLQQLPLVSPSLILPFIAVYFLTGFAHRFDIWYRNHYDELPWYSRSFGISHLHRLVGLRLGSLPAIDDWFIYQYVEPAMCLLLGWIMVLLGYLNQLPTFTLGLWLVLAACALFAKNQMLYYRERDLFLNINDARIVSMNLMASVRGEPNTQKDGWSAIPLPCALDRNGDGMPDALEPPPVSRTPAIDLQAILAANLRPEPQARTPEAQQ